MTIDNLQFVSLIHKIIESMENIKKTCRNCNCEFWIIKQEQEFLSRSSLPLPENCPSCRQSRRLKDRGERNLYRTTCQQCSKNIIVTYDPKKETRKILCKPCYLDYFEKNSALITD